MKPKIASSVELTADATTEAPMIAVDVSVKLVNPGSPGVQVRVDQGDGPVRYVDLGKVELRAVSGNW